MKKREYRKKAIAGCCLVLLLGSLYGCGKSDKDQGQAAGNQGTNTESNEGSKEEMDGSKTSFEKYEEIDSGYLYERSETQFDDVIHYDLTKEDVETVKTALKDAIITDAKIPFDQSTYQYQLHLYDKDENEIYCLVVNQDDRLSYDEMEVQSDSLDDWVATITK